MNVQPSAATAATTNTNPTSLAMLARRAGTVPLTRVSLAYVERRIDIYLRFGEPSRIVRLDHWRRVAMFLAGAVFCRIRWQANDYGTIRWELMVMQACTSLDAAQRIPGVLPGARLLLHAEGEPAVRAVFVPLDAIEALGIAPADVSPAYWRTLGNRVAALAATGIHRRATCGLAGREGVAITTLSTSSIAPYPRSRLRARIVLTGFAATGLAALVWAAFVSPLPRLTYNPSDSVAVAWYRIEPFAHRVASLPRPLSVDSIVLVPLPAEAAALAAQRGYLPTRVPLLKRVGAVSPQEVCIAGGIVRIDGVPAATVLPPTGWAARCHPGSNAAALNLANCSC